MLISVRNQPLYDYYGPLLTQHVRTIFESGLLLDEDYEVLLKSCNFKIYPAKTIKAPLGLIISALTTLGSVFVAKRYDVPFVVVPPLAVTLGLLCLERRSMIKRQREKGIINWLVKNLIKVQKLNGTIIRYTKLRKELGSTEEKEILLYNQNFEILIRFLLDKYQKYFKTCLMELESLANSSNDLLDDFEMLKQMNIEELLVCDCSSFNNYLSITLLVQDVYVLLISKLLNYLALNFCKHLGNMNVSELEYLLNQKLPGINDTLNKLYAEVQKEFNNMRYSTSKKVEIHSKNKRSFTRHVSGKLQQTLVSAVHNLSIIMEKSQAVLHKVESAEKEDDVKKLEKALRDLRDHAFATYESLDVLCKLYGIFSDASRSQDAVKTVTSPQRNNELKQDVEIFNYDDASEPLEENYELFIPKNDTLSTIEEQKSYVDQSSIYLNLMLKELSQSLKQHERFVAARDKRGIKDDDEESSDRKEKTTKESKTPKFDFSALQPKETVLENTDNLVLDLPPLLPPRPSKLHPPPPPPLPSLNLPSLEREGDETASLFDNIRTLSNQIHRGEDVFGDDDCSGDSD